MSELTPKDRAMFVVGGGWQDQRDEAPSLVDRIAAAITEATAQTELMAAQLATARALARMDEARIADLAAKFEAVERSLADGREDWDIWRTNMLDEQKGLCAQLAAAQVENERLRVALFDATHSPPLWERMGSASDNA